MALKTRRSPVAGPNVTLIRGGASIFCDNNATPLGVSYALGILTTSDGSLWG